MPITIERAPVRQKPPSDITPSHRAVIDTLRSGQSAHLVLVGDSTGVNTLISDTTPLRWFLGGVKKIAARLPGVHVLYRAWDGANTRFGAWQTLQSAGGRRYLEFPGSGGRTSAQKASDVGDLTGDIDVRILLSPTAWVPGVAQAIMARNSGVGLRGWMWRFVANGDLTFQWFPSPASETNVVLTATAASVAGVNGTAQWLRMVVDVDNGSNGYTATMYRSGDGVTWTQIATTTTSSGGPTAVGNPTGIDYEVGGRGNVTDIFAGRIYETQIRNGINGPILDTQGIECWTTPNASSVGGSPTLYVSNGSQAGQGLTYFADPSRVNELVFPVGPAGLVLLSTGHNEGSASGGGVDHQSGRMDQCIEGACPVCPDRGRRAEPGEIPGELAEQSCGADPIGRVLGCTKRSDDRRPGGGLRERPHAIHHLIGWHPPESIRVRRNGNPIRNPIH